MEKADHVQLRSKLGQQDALLESVPERYDGAPGECRAFQTQCQMIFSLQPLTFPTDATRVAYIITQLTGKVKKWGTAAWSADRPYIRMSDCFMTEIHRVIDRSSTGPEGCVSEGRSFLSLFPLHSHPGTGQA